MDARERPALNLDLTGLQLDRSLGLSEQIHAQLKARILQGRLAASLRLPTTRELAQALGVSRNTVVRAYEQLLSEACIESRPGAGTFVAPVQSKPSVIPGSVATPRGPDTALWSRLEAWLPNPSHGGPVRAFRHGVPAMDLFPFEVWSRLQARFWRHHQQQSLGYSDPAGDARLRELIATYLNSSRGLQCEASQVLVTTGSQQAISLCGLALLRPGDRVAVETPGYRAAAAALGLAGAELIGVPVDAQGLRVQALHSLGAFRLAYVTPSHQFPSGAVMSLQRRLDLLAWAQAQNAYVLEDDYDGEYRYSGAPLQPLASLDTQARVLYIGTFSKLMFPGLRLGYLVAPKAWLPVLAKLRSALDRHAPIADQVVMADFMAEGHFGQHVRRMRRVSRARRDALHGAWQRHLGARLPLPVTEAGLHACLPLDSLALEQSLADSALAHGVEVGRLSQIGANTAAPVRPGLMLGFAGVSPEAIAAAVATLARCWTPVLG
ncbi:PLP-dependent aminotransferase family protein [Roseateles toxinivorans]|uniref:GntR family transcriptional regulator n=1 Tax=Roseateles toxinivorans TaxID=270368 RepID=A0A4R6QSY0_9BURK|nr:PLP-dependent aminotransferase family protein [Roseateles toxinivorans]TDP74451.1 GntR family transcriptional regulator [Roseateles toxinivorans]